MRKDFTTVSVHSQPNLIIITVTQALVTQLKIDGAHRPSSRASCRTPSSPICHAFPTPELAGPEKRCFRLFGHLRRLFLGPGFRLVARWNRLGEAVKTRTKREKTGKKWARYGLKGVKEGS